MRKPLCTAQQALDAVIEALEGRPETLYVSGVRYLWDCDDFIVIARIYKDLPSAKPGYWTFFMGESVRVVNGKRRLVVTADKNRSLPPEGSWKACGNPKRWGPDAPAPMPRRVRPPLRSDARRITMEVRRHLDHSPKALLMIENVDRAEGSAFVKAFNLRSKQLATYTPKGARSYKHRRPIAWLEHVEYLGLCITFSEQGC